MPGKIRSMSAHNAILNLSFRLKKNNRYRCGERETRGVEDKEMIEVTKRNGPE